MVCRLYQPRLAVVIALGFAGCATSTPRPMPFEGGQRAFARQTVRLVFEDGKAFAQEGKRRWSIAEVGRDELLWAPDGERFAYIKVKSGTGEAHEIVVRNIRGDSVNTFAVYRPGRPSQLYWVDDDQLAYRAPPDKTGDAYIVHSVQTGEILSVHRGKRFVWSPGHKRLAYVAGKKRAQVIKIGDQRVWPREAADGRRSIVSDLVWSPDGNGLAFMELSGRTPRLVVMLVVDNSDGDLTWTLPKGAYSSANKVFWAESKVLIGESTFKPRFAASWTRVQ